MEPAPGAERAAGRRSIAFVTARRAGVVRCRLPAESVLDHTSIEAIAREVAQLLGRDEPARRARTADRAPGRRALQRRPQLGLRARRRARRRSGSGKARDRGCGSTPPWSLSASGAPGATAGRARRFARARPARRCSRSSRPRADAYPRLRARRHPMAPRPTGEVIERERERGRVFALRFRAYGRRHFVTLGGAADGWTRQKAEAELRHVLADVERGLWAPGVARHARRRRRRRRSTSSRRSGSRPAEANWRDHDRRLHVAAQQPPAAVLPPPPAAADHRRRGRPLPRVQGPRAGPLGRVDQQDDHPARADPRRRRGARPDRPQPGSRQHPQPQAQGEAEAAGLPRLGRADRRDDRRGDASSTRSRRRARPGAAR